MATVNSFCYNCDIDFKVKFSNEDENFQVCHCPFCGKEIEADDGDVEDENLEFNMDDDE